MSKFEKNFYVAFKTYGWLLQLIFSRELRKSKKMNLYGIEIFPRIYEQKSGVYVALNKRWSSRCTSFQNVGLSLVSKKRIVICRALRADYIRVPILV